jgi:hypothetical protein
MFKNELLHFTSFYTYREKHIFFGNFHHYFSFVSDMKFTTTHALITTSKKTIKSYLDYSYKQTIGQVKLSF